MLKCGFKKIDKTVSENNKAMLASYDGIPDFSDVKGQENVKRALEIAAAGRIELPFNRKPGLTEKLCFLEGYLQFFLN